jgi:glucose/arabinose dehydrogenase
MRSPKKSVFLDYGQVVKNIGVWSVFLVNAGRVQAVPTTDVVPIITGLNKPVAITHAGDGSNRLFITQQRGRIRIYEGGQVLPTPFLDIRDHVSCCGERGLLGAVFHPNYPSNGFFYINYTNTEGNTVIARYTVSSDPNVADPNSAAFLLEIPQPFANHNGGQLQFGPDGYLYIGMGDGGSEGDPQNNAQRLGTLLGKMLRIDVEGDFPYAIPADNPFVGNPEARGEIWAWGLRNPWRFSFDPLKGHLFIADVGQGEREEINFQPAGSPGGENYGWPLMEGTRCFKPSTGCNDGTLTLPVIEYEHDPGCSVIGGYRYRGTQLPHHYGTYFYGDFCSGRIWGARRDGQGRWVSTELLSPPEFMVSTFGENERRELFVADYASGTIYRLVTRNDGPLIIANETLTDPNGGTLEPGDEIRFRVVLRNLGNTDQADNSAREFWGGFNHNKLELLHVGASSGQVKVVPRDHPIRWNGVIPAQGQVRITISARIRSGVSGKVCNRGLAYYDADLNGSNETEVPTDDPKTPIRWDPTCAEIGQDLAP